jgi:hypothetical protein
LCDRTIARRSPFQEGCVFYKKKLNTCV